MRVAAVVALALLAATAVSAVRKGPPPALTFKETMIPSGFPQAIDIRYNDFNQKLAMSVNYFYGIGGNFAEASVSNDCSGASCLYSLDFTTFAPQVSGLTDEVYIDHVPALAAQAGWTVGDLYFGTGVDGVIGKVDANGMGYDMNWLNLHTCTPGGIATGQRGVFRGGVRFDDSGLWNYDLLLTTDQGEMWRVDVNKQCHFLTRINHTNFGSSGLFMEGATIIPNNPARFGPLAGTFAAGGEDKGFLYFVDQAGNLQSWRWPGSDIEQIEEYEDGRAMFGVDYQRQSILSADASQFTGDWSGSVLVSLQFPNGTIDGACPGGGSCPNLTPSLLYLLEWDFDANEPYLNPVPLTPASIVPQQWESYTFAPIPPCNCGDCLSRAVIAHADRACTSVVAHVTGTAAAIEFDGPAGACHFENGMAV